MLQEQNSNIFVGIPSVLHCLQFDILKMTSFEGISLETLHLNYSFSEGSLQSVGLLLCHRMLFFFSSQLVI